MWIDGMGCSDNMRTTHLTKSDNSAHHVVKRGALQHRNDFAADHILARNQLQKGRFACAVPHDTIKHWPSRVRAGVGRRACTVLRLSFTVDPCAPTCTVCPQKQASTALRQVQ